MAAIRSVLDNWHHFINGQSSEGTDLSNFTVPANSTSGLVPANSTSGPIEEDKEEDEINTTTPTDIKSEQLADTGK